jgi:hypothetical protein
VFAWEQGYLSLIATQVPVSMFLTVTRMVPEVRAYFAITLSMRRPAGPGRKLTKRWPAAST